MTNSMTPAAKQALSRTIRSLRERLLSDLRTSTEATYRLSVGLADAGLDDARRTRRQRLEAYLKEQERAQENGGGKNQRRSQEEFLREVEKKAAYTFLHRLILLRMLEAPGPDGKALRRVPVLTEGWQSRGYRTFRALAPELLGDDSEGYDLLLQLVFEELVEELPGLYGPAGVADLIPIPIETLRHTVQALDDPALESCWTDDLTLGWVYQYWNDPDREALDAKLNARKKLANHEIASKTQMFTERYLVDWILQNSLGPLWMAICRKNGWVPEVESTGTLAALEARRKEWREKRDKGEVELTELMPLETELERRWAYYLPQEVPEQTVETAPESVRDLKILDPAVGSGHFLVVAMELLFHLYQEEARHRGETDEERWSDRAIVERILSHNLHGIDIDPRAIQIAAASLWRKAQQLAPGAKPAALHLVAPDLRLARLPDDDPALQELRDALEEEIGLPPALTNALIESLQGADHLGSLLKVGTAVDDALRQHEEALRCAHRAQGGIFEGFPEIRDSLGALPTAKATLLHRLEAFLERHSKADDLGLRLRGQQLAAGVRFLRMIEEGRYDLVVANPPYQGASSLADASYLQAHYPLGRADLYAAFLLRCLELVREGGISAMLTMRGWMFIKTYSSLRRKILQNFDLRTLGDFGAGSFKEVGGVVVSVCASVIYRQANSRSSVALNLANAGEGAGTLERALHKEAASLSHVGRHEFSAENLRVVPEWPLVYWWDDELLEAYQSAPLIGDVSPGRMGANVGDNTRFHRSAWELAPSPSRYENGPWRPLIKGAAGKSWLEPLDFLVQWNNGGLEPKLRAEHVFGTAGVNWKIANSDYYFWRGVAFSMIGANFSARVHRYPSIFGDMGSSIFPEDLAGAVCAMNSARSRQILQSLNPTVHFQVGDVNRLPLFPIEKADEIFATVEAAFDVHEAHRESSVEFKRPGPSPWRHVQAWAQLAVDRPQGAPLPPYEAEYDPEPPTDHISFALGVALGRFGPEGEGVLDPATADLSHALPHGILFLDGTLAPDDRSDGLGHAAAERLWEAWEEHGPAIDTRRGLRDYLRLEFFRVHERMYEKRPIHWPLSSASRTYVAWVNIHRFDAQTLHLLLADHLVPTLRRLEGEVADLAAARASPDRRAAREADRRYEQVMRAKDELQDFIDAVEQVANWGPPQPDASCPEPTRQAPYDPVLDDGVMINSAALWRLLDPQWKEPKKWWKELAQAKGRKDYDWSRLAMRYFPKRVDEKCKQDPSLAVAHGCFWRYHPERAWAWELRLQDEIGQDFQIDEVPYRPGDEDLGDPGSDAHREAFLREQPERALELVEAEAQRRIRTKKGPIDDLELNFPGLWSAIPEQVWEMEDRIIQWQKAEFVLVAPDDDASEAFLDAHPELREARAALLRKLAPEPTLFSAADEPETDDDADAGDPDDEEVA